MTETVVEIKPNFHAAWGVVRTLKVIGGRLPDQFHKPLTVRYFCTASDYPGRPSSFYYLAEGVPTKLLHLIPRTQKRVLVTMSDPSRHHGDQVGCTVLDARTRGYVEEEVRNYARLKGTENVTILTDNNPLFI